MGLNIERASEATNPYLRGEARGGVAECFYHSSGGGGGVAVGEICKSTARRLHISLCWIFTVAVADAAPLPHRIICVITPFYYGVKE